MKTSLFRYGLLPFLLLLLFPIAESVGIVGTSLTYTEFFVPNGEFTYNFKARPTKNNQELEFTSSGQFGDYVTFSPTRVTGDKNDRIPFTATIVLPSEAPEPGKSTTRICVEEVKNESLAQIGVRTRSCGAIYFISLYDGKYITSKFTAPNVNAGENVVFLISVDNWGKEDILALRADVDIFEGDKKIGTVSTDTESLLSTEGTTLEAYWNSEGYKEGKYSAKATIYYDGNTQEKNTEFNLGTLNVIINEYTKEAKIGEINEFYISVTSGWNSKIDSIYGEVIMLEEGTQITSFKTVSDSLDPWQNKNLIGYLDGKKIARLGEYDIDIILHYMGETTRETGKINIIESTAEETPESQGIGISTIILITVLVAIIVVFVVLNRFKHGR